MTGGAWSRPQLAASEAESRQLKRPEFVADDFANGRYRLLIGADPHSYALTIDLATAVRDAPGLIERATANVVALRKC